MATMAKRSLLQVTPTTPSTAWLKQGCASTTAPNAWGQQTTNPWQSTHPWAKLTASQRAESRGRRSTSRSGAGEIQSRDQEVVHSLNTSDGGQLAPQNALVGLFHHETVALEQPKFSCVPAEHDACRRRTHESDQREVVPGGPGACLLQVVGAIQTDHAVSTSGMT